MDLSQRMAQKVILKLKTAVNFGTVKTLTASEEISRLWRENKFSLLSLYYFSWIFDIENCLYTCKSSLILKWYLDRKYKSTKCKMAVGKFNRGVLVVFSLKYATTWKLTITVWGLIVARGHFTTDSEPLLLDNFLQGTPPLHLRPDTSFCPEKMFVSPLY